MGTKSKWKARVYVLSCQLRVPSSESSVLSALSSVCVDLNRGINSRMQSKGQNYSSRAKSFISLAILLSQLCIHMQAWEAGGWADGRLGGWAVGLLAGEQQPQAVWGRQKLEGLFKFQLVSKTFKKFPLLTDC